MTQITRMFVPNLDSFPEQFKTTALGVNDLVEHCISKGYVKTGNNGASNTSAQAALTMAVQPCSRAAVRHGHDLHRHTTNRGCPHRLPEALSVSNEVRVGGTGEVCT